MTQQTTEIIPSASRLMASMRSVGYGFENAVADIVDNSIAAGATKIIIEPKFSGMNSYLIISDNGKGMRSGELNEAMRFGSESDYSPSSLGKFGLGLKTSSLSQCTCFYVASMSEDDGSVPHLVSWDFDYVRSSDKWEILHPLMNDPYSKLCCKYLNNNSGTAVLWRRMDTLFKGIKDIGSKHARNHFFSKCRDMESHLSMVFHRFLSGENGKSPIEIILSGNKILPWDPFARDYRGKAETLEFQDDSFEVSSGSPKVVYKGFVLPSQREFDSKNDFDKYAGPKKWNRQQGFYIYRSDRMIQSGGWSGIRVIDEHTKLARAYLDFSSELDKDFGIDIGKMKVSLPSEYKDHLTRITKALVAAAKDRYKGDKNRPGPPPPPPPRDPKYTLEQVKEMLIRVSDEEVPFIKSAFEKLIGGNR